MAFRRVERLHVADALPAVLALDDEVHERALPQLLHELVVADRLTAVTPPPRDLGVHCERVEVLVIGWQHRPQPDAPSYERGTLHTD